VGIFSKNVDKTDNVLGRSGGSTPFFFCFLIEPTYALHVLDHIWRAIPHDPTRKVVMLFFCRQTYSDFAKDLKE
jgi:hypothetical protein